MELPASLVWPQSEAPLQRLVIRRIRGGLSNAIGLDVSRRLGLPTPHTTSVRFYVTGDTTESLTLGVNRGIYSVTEHLSRQFLRRRYGHGEFDFFRGKEDGNNEGQRRFIRELMQLGENSDRYDLADLSGIVDVNSLFAQHVLHLLLEAYDVFQGLAARDRTDPDAKWFFVPWDLDNGLTWAGDGDNLARYNLPRDYHAYFSSEDRTRPQSRIWRDLQNDTDFRQAFAGVAVDALNHRVTPEWVDMLIDRHKRELKEHGSERDESLEESRRSLIENREKLFLFLAEQWALGPLHTVEVLGPQGTQLVIDGHVKEVPYTGQYLNGAKVVVQLQQGEGRIASWKIRGRQTAGSDDPFAVEVNQDTRIEAVAR